MKIKVSIIIIFYLIIIFLELISILYLNHGIFTYTLDDAYIHLSLAQNILKGNYGININEFSSPSSSIIWPFLLAPFSTLGFYNLVPLIMNIIFTTVILFLIIFLIKKHLSVVFTKSPLLWLFFIALYFILIFNLTGLIFTGMEHSLQILFVLIITIGLIELNESQKVPLYLNFFLICAPLIRYENIAISLSGILFLYLTKNKKQAAISFLLMSFLLALFSLFLYVNNNEFLPNSIILKSTQFNQNNKFIAPINNFLKSLKINEGLRLAYVLIAIFYYFLYGDHKNESKKLALITIFAITLHLLFGQYGWFHRYEIYIWIFSSLVLIYLYKNLFIKLFSPSYKNFIFLTAASILLFHNYYYALLSTPFAANNIYEQHYFMHKFVNYYYKGNVGVHDIGYVSFNNTYYVLDVNGLSNKKVLNFRKNQINSSYWLEELANLYQVNLFIVYEKILDIPDNWLKIGSLHLSRPNIIAFDKEVSFFIRNNSDLKNVLKAINKYIKDLPPEVKFKFTTNIL